MNERELKLRRLLLIASIANVLLSSQLGNAYAAGPYEGEWKGSTTPVTDKRRCKPGSIALSVVGNDATGQAVFEGDQRNIMGTVSADGTFGGTIGFMHLKGRFREDGFKGSFSSADCAWNMDLTRTGNKRGPSH